MLKSKTVFFLFAVGLANGSSHGDWIQTLKDLWALLGDIGKMLVTLIVEAFEALFGVKLPSWTVSLVVVGLLSYTFLKVFKRLPKIIVVIVFFVVVAVISSLIVTLML